jgi:tRNA threonylcarbamoyladenosine biosynthesis protein TsaB
MTTILALETSTEWCSVALAEQRNGHIHLTARQEQTGPRSSDRILPLVDIVLSEAGVELSACDAIAFGAGPGSFTGLRTACGVAQGLAFGIERPVIAVNSLEACAEQVSQQVGAELPTDTPVIVALDARMNECYWATFRLGENGWQTMSPTQVSAPENLAAPTGSFWIIGNALTVFSERLTLASQAVRCLPDVLPHARGVALIGLRSYAAGLAQPAEMAAPLYVRDKVALTVSERQAVAAAKVAASAAVNASVQSGQ